MCELFGLSANIDVGVKISFKEFFEHSRIHRDGWGVGFYKDNVVVLFKEPKIAKESPLVEFIEKYDYVRSHIVISHIRRASRGGVAYRNTHPFVREVFGRMWVFAHNGTLTGIRHRFSLRFYKPVGETDSEFAFCYILDKIRELGENNQDNLNLLYNVIQNAAAELDSLGKFNFLLSNGKYLFAYANRSGTLYYLQRYPPHTGEIVLRDKQQRFTLSELKRNDEIVTLIATTPLSNENWQELPLSTLMVIEDGIIQTPMATQTFESTEIKVLRFIREAPHRVFVRDIMRHLNLSFAETIKALKNLRNKKLIRQDSRDAETGARWNTMNASYYTMPSKREYIDSLLSKKQ